MACYALVVEVGIQMADQHSEGNMIGNFLACKWEKDVFIPRLYLLNIKWTVAINVRL